MLYNNLVTALVRHAFLHTPWGAGLGGCINDVKAFTVVKITRAIQKMIQAAPDYRPNPMPEGSSQEILDVRNSHVRMLTLLHDILLAQYRISVPPQSRTPHRLMIFKHSIKGIKKITGKCNTSKPLTEVKISCPCYLK